jgi:hypothetical protein
MARKAAAISHAVKQPFDRIDEPGKNVEWRPGDSWPSDHPDTDKYVEWGLVEIVPAPAGSSQPGESNEGAE